MHRFGLPRAHACAASGKVSGRPFARPSIAMASTPSSASADAGSEAGASPPKAAASKEVSAAAHLCGIEEEAAQTIKKVSLANEILNLRAEQLQVRNDRKRIQKELKNAQRRKRRLKEKARQLTNHDLLEVLLMRKAEKDLPSSQESTRTGEDEDTKEKPTEAEEEPDAEK